MPVNKGQTSTVRKLAAIMFTDIVGYTALMGKDEDQAFEVLKINKQIHTRLIEKYQGTLIKEMGDGILTSFNSSSDAVRCAIEIQKACKEKAIPLKIGIHEGEMVFSGEDVLGDGVNIASRLEAITETGEITISEAICRNVKNKAGIHTAFLEEKLLKNVDEPVKMYRVSDREISIPKKQVKSRRFSGRKINYIIIFASILLLAAVILWKLLPSAESAGIERSIAVMPFENASAEEENQYFVDGMMEDIRNNLSIIGDLRVVSKTSTEKYRNTNRTAAEIAQDLDVNYLLEGTAQKQGSQVKIHAQLIRAETDDHIWVRTYTEDLSDVFKVQSQIAQSIAEELKATISPQVRQRMDRPATESPEAYEIYLRAREYHTRYGDKFDIRSAVDLYQQALELDPEFSLAWLYLGEALVDETWFEVIYKNQPDAYKIDTLSYFINKALEIDPYLADAYMQQGIQYLSVGRYEEGVNNLEKAIELDPNLGRAYGELGFYYSGQGEYAPALINCKKSKRLRIGEPDYKYDLRTIFGIYLRIGDYEKAEATGLDLAKIDPMMGYQSIHWLNTVFGNKEKSQFYADKMCSLDSGSCLGNISQSYADSGNYEQALYYYDLGIQLGKARGEYVWDRPDKRGFLYYKLGRTEEALTLFDEWIELINESIKQGGSGGYSRNWAYNDIARVYALIGEREKAYQYLYQMEENITGEILAYIQNDQWYESLWADKEFNAYVERNDKKFADIRAEVDRLEATGEL